MQALFSILCAWRGPGVEGCRDEPEPCLSSPLPAFVPSLPLSLLKETPSYPQSHCIAEGVPKLQPFCFLL